MLHDAAQIVPVIFKLGIWSSWGFFSTAHPSLLQLFSTSLSYACSYHVPLLIRDFFTSRKLGNLSLPSAPGCLWGGGSRRTIECSRVSAHQHKSRAADPGMLAAARSQGCLRGLHARASSNSSAQRHELGSLLREISFLGKLLQRNFLCGQTELPDLKASWKGNCFIMK